MGRLEGKVALITGGGAGIGAATGRLFCSEGAAVMLVDANGEALANARRAIEAHVRDARVETFIADVGDAAGAHEAVGKTLEVFQHIDVLVNNAAMRNYSAVADATPAEWESVVRVNLFGAANYCRAALPALRASKRGSIINVSSGHAVSGRKGMAIYDATKAALLSLTRTLACEEAGQGIRVNAICPGSTLTDFHVGRGHAAGKSVEVLKTERQTNSLMGRWATPEEVAWPILWLASDEASFITATTLMVDGGLSAI